MTGQLNTTCPDCGEPVRLTVYRWHRKQMHEHNCRRCSMRWKILRYHTNRGYERLTWIIT